MKNWLNSFERIIPKRDKDLGISAEEVARKAEEGKRKESVGEKMRSVFGKLADEAKRFSFLKEKGINMDPETMTAEDAIRLNKGVEVGREAENKPSLFSNMKIFVSKAAETVSEKTPSLVKGAASVAGGFVASATGLKTVFAWKDYNATKKEEKASEVEIEEKDRSVKRAQEFLEKYSSKEVAEKYLNEGDDTKKARRLQRALEKINEINERRQKAKEDALSRFEALSEEVKNKRRDAIKSTLETTLVAAGIGLTAATGGLSVGVAKGVMAGMGAFSKVRLVNRLSWSALKEVERGKKEGLGYFQSIKRGISETFQDAFGEGEKGFLKRFGAGAKIASPIVTGILAYCGFGSEIKEQIETMEENAKVMGGVVESKFETLTKEADELLEKGRNAAVLSFEEKEALLNATTKHPDIEIGHPTFEVKEANVPEKVDDVELEPRVMEVEPDVAPEIEGDASTVSKKDISGEEVIVNNKIKPLEIKVSSKGAIQTFIDLREELREQYADVPEENRPEIVNDILKKESGGAVGLARKFGFYNPGEEQESFRMLENESIRISEGGNLEYVKADGTVRVLEEGGIAGGANLSEDVRARMFSADAPEANVIDEEKPASDVKTDIYAGLDARAAELAKKMNEFGESVSTAWEKNEALVDTTNSARKMAGLITYLSDEKGMLGEIVENESSIPKDAVASFNLPKFNINLNVYEDRLEVLPENISKDDARMSDSLTISAFEKENLDLFSAQEALMLALRRNAF